MTPDVDEMPWELQRDTSRGTRRLLDMYGDSLKFVNKLLNAEFGASARKVGKSAERGERSERRRRRGASKEQSKAQNNKKEEKQKLRKGGWWERKRRKEIEERVRTTVLVRS